MGCTSAVPSVSAWTSGQMEHSLTVYRCCSVNLDVQVKSATVMGMCP